MNIITRRSFFDRSFKIGAGVALSTLTDIPLVMKKALAEGTIGLNGKKLLFIFLRGGMDGLNCVVPVQDPAYSLSTVRPLWTPATPANLGIPIDGEADYATNSPGTCYFPTSSSDPVDSNFATFWYQNAISLGNGFNGLHPALKFLAPVYNAGDLAVLHRVGYPKQSRSHFDSQIYWENGNPNNNLIKDGIFYRTILESGLAHSSPLTGVSIQSALPLILRGSDAALTNLSDPTRYNLLGIPNDFNGNIKADNFIVNGNSFPFPDKLNRDLLELQYKNMTGTLSIFAGLNFTDSGNTFKDDANTDGDTGPYYLFPTSNAKNGGYAAHSNNANKYVVDTGAYSFFTNLKAAAMLLNNTDAIIAGTELGGFDTHNSQGGVTGTFANLQKRLGWAIYALQKYFKNYSNKTSWNDVVVITLSEFGRTTIQNSNGGTDHAEAGVMMVAGGGVNGGTYGCRTNEFTGGNSSLNWVPGQSGSMFGVSSRYLKRIIDYRSVLGEIIRDHLGATQGQLNRIIPGYGISGEKLMSGGASSIDGTTIRGEVGVV